MTFRRALPLALAILGLLKAIAVLWVGARLGLTPWVVTIAAAAWALGPAVAAWLWSRRRRALARAQAAIPVR